MSSGKWWPFCLGLNVLIVVLVASDEHMHTDNNLYEKLVNFYPSSLTFQRRNMILNRVFLHVSLRAVVGGINGKNTNNESGLATKSSDVMYQAANGRCMNNGQQ